jgi:hypothetical protein
MPKHFTEEYDIFAFSKKNDITDFFYIFLIVSFSSK